MSKCCANCKYCVKDTCKKEFNGEPRNMYVGENNTMSGCSSFKAAEDKNAN